MFLSKTHYSPLSTGSTQEDLSQHDYTLVDWDIKNQNKQTNLPLSQQNNWETRRDTLLHPSVVFRDVIPNSTQDIVNTLILNADFNPREILQHLS